MRAAILGILFLAIAGAGAGAGGKDAAGSYRAQVVRIIDGDTLVVQVAIWPTLTATESVRLRGVDAPETRRAKCSSERARGLRAKAWLTRAAGATVTLTDIGRDKYGRLLATVSSQGRDLAAGLIAAGLGRPYTGGHREGWCD